MRINQQIQIISSSNAKLSLTPTVQGSTKIYQKVSSLNKTLRVISEMPHFTEKLVNIRKYLPENFHGESITLAQNDAKQFEAFMGQLRAEMNSVLKVLKAVSTEADENSLFILLPDFHDYHGFVNEVTEYGKIFDQTLSGLKGTPSVKFTGVDLGTNWLILTFGTSAALKLIAGLIWSGCVIRKKKLEGDHLTGQIKNLEMKNESVKDLVAAQKKLLDQLIEAEAYYLIDNNGIEKDPEYIKRLMYSIEKISEMINKGTEFHPSLSAPEESSQLFPDYKKLDSIRTHIKQIRDNTESVTN